MESAIKLVRDHAGGMRGLRAPAAQAALDEIVARLEIALGKDGAPAPSSSAEVEHRAPMQSSGGRHGRPRGSITWAEHEEIYAAYAARNGTRQSAQLLADRGGFGWSECEQLLGREPRTWRPA